jgi:hypothetical protein
MTLSKLRLASYLRETSLSQMGMHDPVEMQNKRPRSMTHSGGYYSAIFWSVLNFLCFASTLIFVALYIYDPAVIGVDESKPRIVIIAGISISLLTFIIAFIKRRSARCPLCKGTPLLNTGAQTHQNAEMFSPFNHGYTAVLSILLTQKVCCMYCGTKYDLLKTSGKKNRRGIFDEDEE